MRVVQDSAKSQTSRRRGDGAVATGAGGATSDLVQAGTPLAAAARPGLPLLQAAVFLAACAIGGVVIALIRPFGIG